MVTIKKKKVFDNPICLSKKRKAIHSNESLASMNVERPCNQEVNDTVTSYIKKQFDDGIETANNQDKGNSSSVETVSIDIKKILDEFIVASMDTVMLRPDSIDSTCNRTLKHKKIDKEHIIEEKSQEKESVDGALVAPDVEMDEMSIKKSWLRYQRPRLVTIISDMIFYSIIFIVGILILFYIGTNTSLFGYQLYHVIDNSMEPTFRQGSILIVKDVEVNSIKIGDAITFYQNKGTIITREIIAIDEANNTMREYQFHTKQIGGNSSDIEIVLSSNVLGKVKTNIPFLGSIDTFMRKYIEMVLIAFTIILIITSILRYFFGEEKKK